MGFVFFLKVLLSIFLFGVIFMIVFSIGLSKRSYVIKFILDLFECVLRLNVE